MLSRANNAVAARGTVSTQYKGSEYVGSYVVHAYGRGRRRYEVTHEKQVTVSFQGRSKSMSVGTGGVDGIASVVLSELVMESLG